MKYLPFLFSCFIITLLSGCSSSNDQGTTISSDYDCGIISYYENIQLNKEAFYEYNKEENQFFITIPELCILIHSVPLDIFGVQPEEYLSKKEEIFIEKNMEWIKEELEQGVLVKNNTIVISGDKEAFLLFNKRKDIPLEEHLSSIFNLNTGLCDIRVDNDGFSIHTEGIFDEDCGKFPYIVGNFGIIYPYHIIYSDTYPEIYILQQPDISGGSHLLQYIEIKKIPTKIVSGL